MSSERDADSGDNTGAHTGADARSQLADDLFGDDSPTWVSRTASTRTADSHDSSEDEGENARGDHQGDDDENDEDDDDDDDDDNGKTALEYYEEDADASTHAMPAVVEEQTAWINVPQLPVRRTKETLLARLPNFVRYADRAFDPATWNEDDEDEQQQQQQQQQQQPQQQSQQHQQPQQNEYDSATGDQKARKFLRTMSTVRWRWKEAGPSRVTPQSNARIVRWDDGTESLQIGSEFFDMTRHAEPSAQGTPLTYIYVPHAEEGVLEAECPVRTSLSFKPGLHSDTHSRIASAIRHQRGMRVVASSEMFGTVDPEREKERIERQLKESEKRKIRERVKAMRDAHDYEGDLDLGMRRHGIRHRRGRMHVTEWSDDDDDVDDTGDHENGTAAGGASSLSSAHGSGRRRASAAYDYQDEDDDDDGFIVHDDEDMEGEPDHDRDASEDDMDRADREIEEHERMRRESNLTSSGGKRARTDSDS